MTMTFKRSDRVADSVKIALSRIILHDVRDEKLSLISISAVAMSDDLRQARVYFVPIGSAVEPDEAKEHLERATGFFRRELGKRVKLKYVPELRFFYDQSFDYGERIEKILSDITE